MSRQEFGTYVETRTRLWNICKREGPDQTSERMSRADFEHMWATKTKTRLPKICGHIRSRLDFETYVDNEGPEQNSDYNYIDRDSPEQSSTYVNNEGPELTSEHMWTETAQNRLRNICRQRRSRLDFGTCLDRESPEQFSEHF